MTARVLVAGIGNIFRGDDGFGSEAARVLGKRSLPPGIAVVDYGTRGMHLAYDLLEGYETLIILDALPRGGTPGDLVVLEVGEDDLGAGGFDPHGMEPTSVLGSLAPLGGRLPRTFVVGCEPGDVGEGMTLSPAVAAAVAHAVDLVLRLLDPQPDRDEPRKEKTP